MLGEVYTSIFVILHIYISYHIITINQIYCVCCQPWIHKPQTAVLNGGGVPGTVVDRCRKLLTDIRKDLPSDSVKQIQEPFWCGASDVGDDALIIELCVKHIYICMCMYICTYVYVYVHMYVCMFIYIYTHKHLEWWDWSSLVEHWSICVFTFNYVHSYLHMYIPRRKPWPLFWLYFKSLDLCPSSEECPKMGIQIKSADIGMGM